MNNQQKSPSADLGSTQGQTSGIFRISGNTVLISGTSGDIPQVLALLREGGIVTQANPDLYVRGYRQFGVDDAHELRTRASSRARAIGERRVFVITAASMTSEAQNALLKTLEEPPADALFVFIVPAPETLLPTVRSRAQIVRLAPAAPAEALVDTALFFAAEPSRRMEMLKAVLEKDDDDKYETGLILAFLASLETQAARIKDAGAMRESLEIIYRARMYIIDRGALVKALLESVALLLPRN